MEMSYRELDPSLKAGLENSSEGLQSYIETKSIDDVKSVDGKIREARKKTAEVQEEKGELNERIKYFREELQKKEMGLNAIREQLDSCAQELQSKKESLQGRLLDFFSLKTSREKVLYAEIDKDIVDHAIFEEEVRQAKHLLELLEKMYSEQQEVEDVERLALDFISQKEVEYAEYLEGERIRSIERACRDNNALVVHGIKRTGITGEGLEQTTVMRRNKKVDFYTRVAISLSLQPDLSCSSLRLPTSPDNRREPDGVATWAEDYGLILANGRMGSVACNDSGSMVSGKRRTSTIFNYEDNSSLEKQVHDVFNRTNVEGYKSLGHNEIVVQNPQIAGIFKSYNFNYWTVELPQALERDKIYSGSKYVEEEWRKVLGENGPLPTILESSEAGKKLGVPVYFRDPSDNRFYRQIRDFSGLPTKEDFEEVTVDYILNNVPQFDKQKLQNLLEEEILENNPFNLDLIESLAYDGMISADYEYNHQKELGDLERWIKNQKVEVEYWSKKRKEDPDNKWYLKTALAAYGVASAAKKNGNVIFHDRVMEEVVYKIVSPDELDDFFKRRIGSNGGFRSTKEELQHVTTRT